MTLCNCATGEHVRMCAQARARAHVREDRVAQLHSERVR
jgi:hypothetical protein